MTRTSLALALALLAVTPLPARGAASARTFQDHPVVASPFDGLRWVGDEPEVLVGATWYRPLSIDGVAASDILAFCDERWPGMRRKRFGEDLVEALVLMGHTVPTAVTLELEPLDGGDAVSIEGVEMSRAKRQAILRSNREERAASRAEVSRDAAEADLAEFGARLKDQFAYLQLRGIDLDAELARVRAGLGDVVAIAELAASLREVLMRFGDGHARVTSALDPRPQRFTPFLLDEAEGHVVAYRSDRSTFAHDGLPFVRAIDGRPVQDWIEALRPTLPAGSEQSVRARALGGLRDLDLARARLGVPLADTVTLTLAATPEDASTRNLSLPLVGERPSYGTWPRGGSRLIEGVEARGILEGVGYLRLPEMDDDLVPELRAWMTKFRGTRGVIVDVRGNGGGRRGLLLALAGYLLDEDDAPVVANVAAYRKSELFDDDHLGGSRHLYRADDAHWTERQRAVIEAFAPTFTPEWELPEGFSEWHYLLLDRTGHPDEYAYRGRVLVLCDAHCFSATDIFLGALELLPQVTLVGRASAGGSARAQSFTLPRTGIEVRCASMASFRPDGRLYDGRGIEVDVEVDPRAGDLLVGGGDAALRAALKRLDW